MPNIASVLKQEIARIARREAKAQTATIRKANAQYRRDIAQLKRSCAALAKRVTSLESNHRNRSDRELAKPSVEGRRFSPRGLRSRRLTLGLSAADYAALVGVSANTIYNWEQGKSKPGEEQLAALLSMRALGKREAQRRLEALNRG